MFEVNWFQTASAFCCAVGAVAPGIASKPEISNTDVASGFVAHVPTEATFVEPT